MADYCGMCHTCGTRMDKVLDGEEWCPFCGTYHRYRSHGWVGVGSEDSPCPGNEVREFEQVPSTVPGLTGIKCPFCGFVQYYVSRILATHDVTCFSCGAVHSIINSSKRMT